MAARILLDTHVWLWFNGAPERLSEEARQAFVDPENELFLSAASTWEIAIKHAAGRLELPAPPAQYIPTRLAENNVRPLAIQHSHTLAAASLPMHHSDPFDRMLIAQARQEGLTLATGDARLRAYEAPIMWSRADDLP